MIFTLWPHLLSWLLQLIPNENWVYRLPPALFNLSLTASIVILAVLVVRLLLRKAPRVYSYALWAVVAFRLICPVSFSSDFSLLGILDAPAAEAGQVEYVPITIVHDPHPSVDLIIPEVTDAVNEQLPQGMEQTVGDPLEFPAALASWIWMLGTGAMLFWALSSYFNLRYRLRTAVLLEGNVFQSEHVGSPFILGPFRPKIYIPFGLDESTLRYVLAHEKYHIKRLDHIVKVFSFALLTIHWFNPLCWLAFHLMCKDMEMSCDEKVLSKGNTVKTEYSTVLLSFAANRRFPSPSPLAFGETSAKSRIKNALKWKRPKVWVAVLAAVLCIGVIAACAANPKEEPLNPDASPYKWTSTVKHDDIYEVSLQHLNTEISHRINLASSEVNELTSILNAIPSDSIYTNRGFPARLKVVITAPGQTIIMHYGGGDLVEISSAQFDNSNGIWEIHDKALVEFMENQLKYVTEVYNDLEKRETERITTNADAMWKYAPILSSQYPAFPFQFEFEYTHVQVSCSEGQLINLDADTQGQSLSFSAGQTVYWDPAPESLINKSDVIHFIIYNKGEILHTGSIRVDQVALEEDQINYYYAADLVSGNDLYLTQSDNGGGRIGQLIIHSVLPGEATEESKESTTKVYPLGVTLEYNPYLSSLYPTFPFVFTNFSYSHIEATCSAGQLVNRETGTEGQSMTYYTSKQTLYWTPHTPDSVNVPSSTIQFTAYDGDAAVFSGSILIEQMEGDSFSAVYSARLSAGDELILKKRIDAVGGGIVYRIPVHDLSADGKIELAAWRLSEYHFQTNSTKIYLDFERSEEPIEIQLYATNVEGPLMHFSTTSSSLASCSFSNLTSAREYYFAVKCDSNTLFTIHD